MFAPATKIRLLVFPLDVDRVREMLAVAGSFDMEILGASSCMSAADAARYPIVSFHHLPYVTDPSFEERFLELVNTEQVTHVYSPHGVIWSHLMQCQSKQPDSYRFYLCQPSPYEQDWLRLLPSHQWADEVLSDSFVESLIVPGETDARASMKRSRLVSLHRQFCGVPGQSDEHKLAMLTQIARYFVPGDVVEIGSFQGRSAFALGWLANYYKIGSLICVDPWENSKLEDQGEQAAIVNQELKQGRRLIDLDKIFHSFIAAVSLLDSVGYIREISEVAIDQYKAASMQGFLPENELDAVPVCGEISVLHIDGNHRYDFVRKDADLWVPLVRTGGWVMVDDYVWAFGDGPKRVGDELLASGQFDVAFSASDTLFLRKGTG